MRSFTGTDAAMVEIGSTAITDRASLDRAILEQHFERILAANGPALSRLAASYTNTLSDRDDLLVRGAPVPSPCVPRDAGWHPARRRSGRSGCQPASRGTQGDGTGAPR